MPSGKKEKDIKWLRTNVKKEQELIDTKRKSSFITTFSHFSFIERDFYISLNYNRIKSKQNDQRINYSFWGF